MLNNIVSLSGVLSVEVATEQHEKFEQLGLEPCLLLAKMKCAFKPRHTFNIEEISLLLMF